MLKIGDKVYRVSGNGIYTGIFSYSVKEIRESCDNIQYVIECNNCDDHEPCKILITPHGNSTSFRFVSMLNNNGYVVSDADGSVEYDFHHDHTCYHDTSNGVYFTTTMQETAQMFTEQQIRFLKDRIEKRLKENRDDEENVAKLKVMLESLKGK